MLTQLRPVKCSIWGASGIVSMIKETDISVTVLFHLPPAWNVDLTSGAVATLCDHEGMADRMTEMLADPCGLLR